jgi:hypothetical protein
MVSRPISDSCCGLNRSSIKSGSRCSQSSRRPKACETRPYTANPKAGPSVAVALAVGLHWNFPCEGTVDVHEIHRGAGHADDPPDQADLQPVV